jgi:predicted RNA-binding protein YlqC (UPF0109 family)
MELRMRDNGEYVKWTATPSSVAGPYLIGSGGRHVRALQHLVRGFGDFAGVVHVLAFDDPREGPKRPWSDKKVNPDFDPEGLVKILEDTLEALGVSQFRVETRRCGPTADGAVHHRIEVWVRTDEDYKLLVATKEPDALSNVQAIGTIWRACASIAGGKVNVEVKKA